MNDDRWNLKGSDQTTIEAFRSVKRSFEARTGKRVTNDDALRMLIKGADLEPAVDHDQIREIVREEVREELKEQIGKYR